MRRATEEGEKGMKGMLTKLPDVKLPAVENKPEKVSLAMARDGQRLNEKSMQRLQEKLPLHSFHKIEKEKWTPDEVVHACPSCNAAFGMMQRKHHCRQCGDVFCGRCAPRRSIQGAGFFRMCGPCHASIDQSMSPVASASSPGSKQPDGTSPEPESPTEEEEQSMAAVDRYMRCSSSA